MKKKVKQIVSLCMIVLLLCTSFDLSVFAKDESSEAQSESVKRSMDFNEGWSFQLGDVSGAEKMDFDDGAWRRLTLPHDWSIEQDFTHSVSSEIGHLPGERAGTERHLHCRKSIRISGYRLTLGAFIWIAIST